MNDLSLASLIIGIIALFFFIIQIIVAVTINFINTTSHLKALIKLKEKIQKETYSSLINFSFSCNPLRDLSYPALLSDDFFIKFKAAQENKQAKKHLMADYKIIIFSLKWLKEVKPLLDQKNRSKIFIKKTTITQLLFEGNNRWSNAQLNILKRYDYYYNQDFSIRAFCDLYQNIVPNQLSFENHWKKAFKTVETTINYYIERDKEPPLYTKVESLMCYAKNVLDIDTTSHRDYEIMQLIDAKIRVCGEIIEKYKKTYPQSKAENFIILKTYVDINNLLFFSIEQHQTSSENDFVFIG